MKRAALSPIISRRGAAGHRTCIHMRTAKGLLHGLLGRRTKQLQLVSMLWVGGNVDSLVCSLVVLSHHPSRLHLLSPISMLVQYRPYIATGPNTGERRT